MSPVPSKEVQTSGIALVMHGEEHLFQLLLLSCAHGGIIEGTDCSTHSGQVVSIGSSDVFGTISLSCRCCSSSSLLSLVAQAYFEWLRCKERLALAAFL